MATNQEIYESFTATICDMLDAGEVPPWRKPWQGAAGDFAPKSLAGRSYRGVNVWWLLMAAQAKGYTGNVWGTFKQCKAAAVSSARKAGRNIEERKNGRGRAVYWDVDADTYFSGGVRKGEKSTAVILWKPAKGKDKVAADGTKEKGQGYLLLRTFNVFNAEQCDGIDVEEPAEAPTPVEIAADAHAVFGSYCDREGLSVAHAGDRAYYSPKEDRIQLPPRDSFTSGEGYLATAYHEAAHSTGHAKRLDRKSLAEISHFGSHAYAREELVAEFTAAFLCGVAGVSMPVIENQAAYLRSWSLKLREEPKLLIVCAAQAQKAADYVLGTYKAPGEDRTAKAA